MFGEIYFNPVNKDYWEKVGDRFKLIGFEYATDNILGLVLLTEEELDEHIPYITMQMDKFIEESSFNSMVETFYQEVKRCVEE